MNIQISDLTVTDPLAEQEVAVVVRVFPDSAQRPARTALVSVGMTASCICERRARRRRRPHPPGMARLWRAG